MSRSEVFILITDSPSECLYCVRPSLNFIGSSKGNLNSSRQNSSVRSMSRVKNPMSKQCLDKALAFWVFRSLLIIPIISLDILAYEFLASAIAYLSKPEQNMGPCEEVSSQEMAKREIFFCYSSFNSLFICNSRYDGSDIVHSRSKR